MTRNGLVMATIITTSSIVHKFIQIIGFSHLSSSLYLPLPFSPCMCNLENERVMQHSFSSIPRYFTSIEQDPKSY